MTASGAVGGRIDIDTTKHAYGAAEERRAATVPDPRVRGDNNLATRARVAETIKAEHVESPMVPLDAATVLETMKQSTRELDEILQKLCDDRDGAQIHEHGDARGFGHENTGSANPLITDTNLDAAAYFDLVRTKMKGTESSKGITMAGQALQSIAALKADDDAQAVNDAAAFSRHTSDITFLFPMTDNNADDAENEAFSDDDRAVVAYSVVDVASKRHFEARVEERLLEADHLLPPELAERFAGLVANAVVAASVRSVALPTVQALFPVESVQVDTRVAWQQGTRVCKINVQEREFERQWGIEAELQIESVLRAQAQSVAASTTATGTDGDSELGPPLSAVVTLRLFLAKSHYKTSTRAEPVESTRLSLTLEKGKETTASSDPLVDTEASHVNATVDWDAAVDLPEFLRVYECGSHASPSQSATSPEPTVAHGFQCLRFDAPFPRNRIVQAACGRLHSLLLNDAGMVFSYGHATGGALGHGVPRRLDDMHVKTPRLVAYFLEHGVGIKSIACGGDELTGTHSAAVSTDHAVFTWGNGVALGSGSTQNAHTPTRVTLADIASDVQLAVETVACGSGFCVALCADGAAYSWGKWSDGRLGQGKIPVLNSQGQRRQLQRFQLRPKLLSASVKWRKISCGDAHCVGLARDGRVFTWGRGRQGQLGLGHVQDAVAPVRLTTSGAASSKSNEQHWRDVSAGADWSMAVDERGALWTWGACGAAALAQRHVTSGASAAVVDLLVQRHVQMQHSKTPLKAEVGGDVLPPVVLPQFAWLRPQLVPAFAHGDVAIRSVSAGVHHGAAISELGDLYVWGGRRESEGSSDDETAMLPGLSAVPTLVAAHATGGSDTMGRAIAEQVFCGGDRIVALTSGSFLARAMHKLHALSNFDSGNSGGNADGSSNAVDRHLRANADVVLLTSGRAIYAHKLVLARRSPVLRELLRDEERAADAAEPKAEPAPIELLLPQLRADVARALVEFLYTDNLTQSLDPLGFLIRDVLRAAEQFQVPSLARICRARIARASLLRPLELEMAIPDELELELLLDGDEQAADASATLNDDLAFTFGDTAWSDLEIVAEGHAIPVHRCMLVARSEYFRALLAFHAQQQQQQQVGGGEGGVDGVLAPTSLEVDESYWGMVRVLHFIYNDQLTTLQRRPSQNDHNAKDERAAQADELQAGEEEHTDQLLEDLIAADKYGLARMKRLCEHHIVVTAANCVDVIVVADLVHAPRLKHAALAFLQSHLAQIPAETLQRLTHEYPHLLAELYARIARETQQQQALRDWRVQLERRARAQQDEQERQWATTRATTSFPWVPLVLSLVFATLYLTVMNRQETDYPLVPAINCVALAGLLAAALFGKL